MLRRRCGIYDATTNLLAVEHGRGGRNEPNDTPPSSGLLKIRRVADEGIGGKSSNRILQATATAERQKIQTKFSRLGKQH